MDSAAVTGPLGVRYAELPEHSELTEYAVLTPGVVKSAQAIAVMVSTCAPDGAAATLPAATAQGTLLRTAALGRPPAAVAASTLLSPRAMARYAGQHTSQHTSPKFAIKSRIAATGGAATGPHPAWDPV